MIHFLLFEIAFVIIKKTQLPRPYAKGLTKFLHKITTVRFVSNHTLALSLSVLLHAKYRNAFHSSPSMPLSIRLW